MSHRPWWCRPGIAAASVLALSLIVGCSPPRDGAAIAAAPSAAAASHTATSAPAASTRSAEPAPTAEAQSSGWPAEPEPSPAPGAWAAVVQPGPAQGILSPTGDLTATVVAGSVCFAPDGAVGGCGLLTPGATATFAVFSPDGSHLLLVAAQDGGQAAYVIDAADASARVLAPSGMQDYAPGSTAPVWDLSTAAWNVDGTAAMLLPITTGTTGALLAFDLASGAVTELLVLDALLINGFPSIWTTRTGVALAATTGDQRNILWWADFDSGGVAALANYPQPGGSVALSSADPMGGVVLMCPRRVDGALGATKAVVIRPAAAESQAVTLLPDSNSCAGSVFSDDGRYLAVTAQIDAQYSLMVIDRSDGARLLRIPLSVAAPATPPYLTWLDDVIVATDTGGGWAVPSLIVRLER